MVSGICSSFCLPWEGIGERGAGDRWLLSHAVASSYPAMLCVYRPVYPAIDPLACDSLKTFRRKYRKRSRVAASNVAAISDDIAFDVDREGTRSEADKERREEIRGGAKERKERTAERAKKRTARRGHRGETVRILDRFNGPVYKLPLIEQQITGIVSRFSVRGGGRGRRYARHALPRSLEWKLIMKRKTVAEHDVNEHPAGFNHRIINSQVQRNQ